MLAKQVVIAPQNWSFHNLKVRDGATISCNSPSKLDLPQLNIVIMEKKSCCNSPSKLDLPQQMREMEAEFLSCNSPSKLDLPQLY